MHNWAGNYEYGAPNYRRPQNTDELRKLIAGAERVKVLGSRHSFNDIADSPETQISLAAFDRVRVDPERRTVMVGAGVTYTSLGQALESEGFALPNMASLPHISVVGAVATATHGSGDGNANLAAIVSGLEMVTANGEVVTLSRERDGDTFAGAVVGLGALGAVTALTLQVEPSYAVRQDVYEHLPWDVATAHFDDVTGSAYSVSLFTDWQGDAVNQVWRKTRTTRDDTTPADTGWFGATLAPTDRHPIRRLSAETCTIQRGIPGPWHERLPHFRPDAPPSGYGDELQSEYLIPRANALAALETLRSLREQIAPLLLISEVRTIAADDLWLSPCYQTPCVGIHFTWKPDNEGVAAFLPVLEAALAPFDARPHWGKLFAVTADRLAALYPRLCDFQQLRRRIDPTGKFRNVYLDRCLPL